jgi:hypothetical protein
MMSRENGLRDSQREVSQKENKLSFLSPPSSGKEALLACLSSLDDDTICVNNQQRRKTDMTSLSR